MNDKEIIDKVHSAMYSRLKETGVVAPVDVLMDIGVLSHENHDAWRFGRVSFLEAVCSVNLRKLSIILHEMRVYAERNGLKSSYTVYKRWGMKKKKPNGQGKPPVIPLRFSKSGDPNVEKWYATHFIDPKRVKEIADTKREGASDTAIEE